jgi:galactose mutarotase-like enzyme
VPALGGKLVSLRLAGREWLWTSDTLVRRAPGEADAADDASYVETADTGGFDECLPTVGACTLPGDLPGPAAGVRLPDHGELWSQHAPTERTAAPADAGRGAESAVTRWSGRRLRYAFARTVTVEADGAVRMEYALTSTADAPLPFLWSSHPLLALSPDTRLDLPVAARVRVWAEQGVALGGAGAMHRWPVLRVGAADETRFGPREVDFTRPTRVGDGYACKLFLELPRPTNGSGGTRVRLAVEQGDARLECEVDPLEVPHLGLWVNHGGWTPFAGGTPYRNLGFEPCIGMGDSLTAALGEPWRSAAWLSPGETRRWTLRWRGRRGRWAERRAGAAGAPGARVRTASRGMPRPARAAWPEPCIGRQEARGAAPTGAPPAVGAWGSAVHGSPSGRIGRGPACRSCFRSSARPRSGPAGPARGSPPWRACSPSSSRC